MTLEDEVNNGGKTIRKVSIKNTRSLFVVQTGIEKLVDWYNLAYDAFPNTTKFLSTAVGTIGGDYLAKKIVQGEDITLRDVAFTTAAAVYQSYLYPKLIDYTKTISEYNSVKSFYTKLGVSKEWANTFIIGGLFFIPNLTYWWLLSVKNQAEITVPSVIQAAKSIGVGSIPYLGVDYVVTNKLKKRYCLPVWSAAEIVYNTFLAAVAYLTK